MNQAIIELFVNGPSSGSTIGQLSLFGDEPISLSLSLSDIKDISKRNSSVSEAFTIPADKNNNTLLNHIFNIGSDSTFEPNKKCPAYLNVNGETVINGNLQLTKINVKNLKPISYEVVIYGETANLIKSIGDAYLTDLDFSELDHNFTVDNIMHTWTANTANIGYAYPLIDFGYDLSLNDLNQMIPSGSTFNGTVYPSGGINPSIFKPALSSKYLLDKIFTRAGFTYESNFLNSEAFTETIIPFNGDATLASNPTFTNQYRFKAGLGSDVTISAQSPTYSRTYGQLLNYQLQLNDLASADYGDNAGDYNASTYKYVASQTSVQEFGANVAVNFTVTGLTVLESSAFVRFKWYRQLSGGTQNQFETQIVNLPFFKYSAETYTASTVCGKLNNPLSSTHYPVQENETIWFKIDIEASNIPYPQFIVTNIKEAGTNWYNIVYPDLVPGGTLFYNQFVPKQVKQVEILKNYINMFNLFIIPSKSNEKHLIIEPRQDYYSSGVIKDWTSKLDLSQGITESIISESQSKQILFNMKEDKDYLNTIYKETTQKVYGQYIKNIDNEWLDAKSQQKIEVTFSPSPLENIYNSDEIIVTKIGKVDSNGAFGKTDHNIRLLRKNPTPLATVKDTITMLGKAPQYSYPYAGHLSSPFSDDANPLDYNFGTIEFAFYNTPEYSNLQNITPNNLTYTYWRDYLNDISDKNSRIIKCKMKLTANDIATFNFNDSIYVDGLTPDGGHYFIVQKIVYTPTSNGTSEVELIKTNRRPSETLPKTIKNTNKNTSLRNVIALGGGTSLSRNSIVIGETSTIGLNSEFSFVSGNNNIVGNNARNTNIQGSNVTIGDNITDSYIIGNNVVIQLETDITRASTITASTTISGVTLLGVNNFTATTLSANTVYMPNLEFTSSASTINGTPISAVTTSANLWASGTGVSSIVQVGAGNTASGNYAHAEGAGTTASGYASNAGGYASTARNTGEWARSGNGPNLAGYGQYGFLDYAAATNNAAITEIYIAGNASGTERFQIGVGTAYRYKLNMIASDNSGNVKEWEAIGLIKNVGGTTSMVGSSNVSTYADAAMAMAALGVAADNTNDTLYVEVIGIPATNITWYGKMEYTRIN